MKHIQKVPRPVRLDRLDRLPEHLQQVALGLWVRTLLLRPDVQLLHMVEAREHYYGLAEHCGMKPGEDAYPDFGGVITAVLDFHGADIDDFWTACQYTLSDRPEWMEDAFRWARQVGLEVELQNFRAIPLLAARALVKFMEDVDIEKDASTIH